MYIRLKVLGK